MGLQAVALQRQVERVVAKLSTRQGAHTMHRERGTNQDSSIKGIRGMEGGRRHVPGWRRHEERRDTGTKDKTRPYAHRGQHTL
jgi:hypothetical protein